MKSETKGMIEAGIAYFIFGLSYLFSKAALNTAEPIILLTARFALTFAVLNLLVLLRVFRINLRRNLAGPILLGILQPVLYFLFENYGLKYTTTSFTGMVSSISPVFTVVLGVVFLKEKPNARQWFFTALSVIGVLMISLQGAASGSNTTAGCLCLIAAYLAGAGFSLMSRKLSKEFTPFELTYVMFLVGFVFFSGTAIVYYKGNLPAELQSAFSHPEFSIAVVYLGIFSSVVAYLLSNASLSRLPVARSSVFNSFSTIVSVTAGILVMHDPFNLLSIVAFLLILIGVYGVNRFAD